jgi:hypothetical protein
MKFFILTFLSYVFIGVNFSQSCSTVVAYDNIETFSWEGVWTPSSITSGFSINAFVSPNSSGAVYGIGPSGSGVERGVYVLPAITGLDPGKKHSFSFRLGSYRFSSSSSTRGVDLSDFVEIKISYDGGITYESEMRIRGNNNAHWAYNNAILSKVANGSLSSYQPGGGGDRTLTGDGFSSIELIVLPGPTQLSFVIEFVVNSAGEEWWFDNISLSQVDCPALPVDLLSFDASCDLNAVKISWSTASEVNSDYFLIESSNDAINWEGVKSVKGSGWSNQKVDYFILDEVKANGVYYRLTQYDFDGSYKRFPYIYKDCVEIVKDVIVYPNPANNSFVVQLSEDFSGKELVEYKILNTAGMVVEAGTIETDLFRSVYINSSDWVPGIYAICINVNGTNWLSKRVCIIK